MKAANTSRTGNGSMMLTPKGTPYVPLGYTFTGRGLGSDLYAWAICPDSWRVKNNVPLL